AMERRHRLRCLPCRRWREAHEGGAVKTPLRDEIVGGLPAADTTRTGKLEEIAVKLQHQIRREFHMLVPLVNELKHVAIARDLALWPITGLRLGIPPHEKLDRRTRQRDAF